MSKVKLNYTLDFVIALAFLLAAVSGIAFLFMGSGGYQGGRNADFESALLGINRDIWSDLHALGGLVMITGVVVHLVFHWKWIECVTKQVLPKLPSLRKQEEACEVIA